MKVTKIYGDTTKNMPWEEKSKGRRDVLLGEVRKILL